MEMSTFDKILDDFVAYPKNNVVLEVIDVQPASGNSINEGETASFKVKVTNNGPLNLTNVKLKVVGENGATVRAAVFLPFEPFFISAELPFIGADGGSDILSLPFLQAPAREQESKTLVSVHIHDYEADLGSILENKGGPRLNAKGEYAAEVAPQ
jgi:hypothetical protein